jgi:6-carboxyhexanoate--CoA ligase
MSTPLFSIRMRASTDGSHLSGAERIVPVPMLHGAIQEMVERALGKGTAPEQIVVTIEPVPTDHIRTIRALDLIDISVQDLARSRTAALRYLRSAGVSDAAARAAMVLLDSGPATSGKNMRGAIIMDAATGERLETDQERGVRASRFDWSDEAGSQVDSELARLGLTHFRTKEALALASKVALAPGMVAELCWSDDPDYPAGYVASQQDGYLRFPHLKPAGSPHGGRCFFVDRSGFDLDALQHYLQQVPVLISETGTFRSAADIDVIKK